MERNTKQRHAILEIFAQTRHPLSAEEVRDSARARRARVSIATVYRALKALVAEGVLTEVALPGQAARYEAAEKDHHHFFQCDECRRVYEIAGCPGPAAVSAPKGFAVRRHEVILYGECGECRRPRRAAAPPRAKKRRRTSS